MILGVSYLIRQGEPYRWNENFDILTHWIRLITLIWVRYKDSYYWSLECTVTPIGQSTCPCFMSAFGYSYTDPYQHIS